MVDTIEIRMTRVESDIETLRKTQGALLDRYDEFSRVQRETLEIVTENRSRLTHMEDRLKRMEDRQDNLERIAMSNSAAILEIRQVLFTICDHLDLTIPKPESAE